MTQSHRTPEPPDRSRLPPHPRLQVEAADVDGSIAAAPQTLRRPRHPPLSQGFLDQALAAFESRQSLAPILQVAPVTTRLVIWLSVFGLCALVAASCYARVDLTAIGRGALRAAEPIVLTAPMDGIVEVVHARLGEQVSAGQKLLTIAAHSTQAELLEAEETLSSIDGRQKDLFESRIELLRVRAKTISQRVQHLRRRVHAASAQVKSLTAVRDRVAETVKAGVETLARLEQAEADLSAGKQAKLTLADGVLLAQLELNNAETAHNAALTEREATEQSALARHAAATRLVDGSVVVASAEGVMESVSISPGEFVNAGFPFAKLISTKKSQAVTVFVPARDRAFLSVGGGATLELEQLPAAEFGVLTATTTRISRGYASSEEVRKVLDTPGGPAGPIYRVDLEVTDNEQAVRLLPMVRTGTGLTARFALRQRLAIELIFDPIRRWLE